jgi:hypothetical protein
MPGNSPSLVMPLKGMIKDMHPSVLPENCYAHALNINVEDLDGNGFPIPQNEASTLLNVILPAGYKTAGFKRVMEWNRTIHFIVNPFTGQSAIAEVRDMNCVSHLGNSPSQKIGCGCTNYDALESIPLEKQTPIPCTTMRIIKSAPCLNFSINYPIRIEYDIVKNQLYLYFTDNRNEMRFIYLTLNANGELEVNEEFHTVSNTPGSCGEPVYTSILDCAKIKIQPDVKPVCITYLDELPTGGLKAGVYQFYAALATPTGRAVTKYSPATNEIPLFSRVITSETDYNTNKGISLKVSGFEYNTIHKFYNLAVAKTINNQTSYELVATLPLSTTEFTYTGNDEALERLALSDVAQMFTYYEKAKGVAQANEYLFFNGMSLYPKGNWQRVANLVKLKWQTTQIPINSYRESRLAQKYRSYLRDEIYAFGLVIGFTNGEETSVLHVPCQTQLSAGQGNIVTNADAIELDNCTDEDINRYWQIHNTATVIEKPEEAYQECEDRVWHRGEFAYWESTLKYPNNPEIWGSLCNTPIRHHKFPDAKVTPIHDDQSMIYPIGVVVDHISVHNAITNCVNQGLITPEQRDRIAYYRIVRGNRAANKSIIAKGLLYDVNNIVVKFPDKSTKSYFYPNYPFNTLTDDELISPTAETYNNPDSPTTNYKTPFVRSNRYTFHSPDTHFNNPGIGNILSLESLEHGTSVGQFKEVLDHQKQKFVTTFGYMIATAIGLAIAQEEDKKEEKEVVRKNYHIHTLNDVTAGVTAGTRTFDWTVGGGNVQNIPFSPGNDLTTRNWENFGNHSTDPFGISNRYSEERYVWKTGNRKGFMGIRVPVIDPSAPAPPTGYDIGTIYGEKKRENWLSLFLTAAFAGIAQTIDTLTMSLIQIEKTLEMIYSLIPLKNYALQYQAVGNYNKSDFTNIVAGNKRRYLSDYSYLSPSIQSINEKIGMSSSSTQILFNNWRRESSLYLKHAGTGFTAPNIVDNSRIRIGGNDIPPKTEPGNTIDRAVSSYYGAIKQLIPDQYGSIYDVEYLETGHCPFIYNKDIPVQINTGIYGGDTFINGFALKRKHSFFVQSGFDKPDEADWQYEFLGNVGFPNYYYNTKGALAERIEAIFDLDNLFTSGGLQGFVQNLLGVPKNRLDGAPLLTGGGIPTPGKWFYQFGYIYTWYYGIPYFYVESDVNVDLRHGLDNKENDFYPNQMDFDHWLQEKNVSIEHDNFYHYNRTYSKQNKNPLLSVDGPRFIPNDSNETYKPNDIIYSLPRSIDDSYDSWLVYYAINQHTFDNSRGQLIAVDGIENDKVLARFENNVAIFNAYVTIQTSAQTAIMGTGGMFQTKPQDFLKTDLGFLGTQNTAILHTDFGHIWVDAKRGQIWNLKPGGNGIEELAKNGMRNWFKQNLPFQVLKDFPSMTFDDVDNALKGVGISMGYDKRFNRIFVTKLDYKCINPQVQWDSVEKCFYIPANNGLERQKVDVTNSIYFCNKSWNVAYNVASNFWISFYSFIPNYYIGMEDHFQTGLNSYEDNPGTCSVWDHNLTNKSYQVIYGQLMPIEIDIIPKMDLNNTVLNSVGYRMDVWRYHNEFDRVFIDDVTFNKAIVYNNLQCSGTLIFNYQPENDSRILYPRYDSFENAMQIRISKDKGIWNFNQFYDMVNPANRNIPFLLHNCANTRTYVNLNAMQFGTGLNNEMSISGEQTVVRLINDRHSNYKMTMRWMNFDKQNQ